jgi:hypothetical protein
VYIYECGLFNDTTSTTAATTTEYVKYSVIKFIQNFDF